MSSEFDLESEGPFDVSFALAAVSAFGDVPDRLVPDEVLIAGAVLGFSERFAEAILIDTRSLAFLNDLWTTFDESNGQTGDLPKPLRRILDLERALPEAAADSRWNLRIAHAAGYGWTDEELTRSTQWLMELSSRAFDPELFLAGATRGEGDSAEAEHESWEVYLRAQSLRIFLRREPGMLIVRIESAVSGAFLLTLRWEDGQQLRRQIDLSGRELRFSVDNPGDLLPTSASISG